MVIVTDLANKQTYYLPDTVPQRNYLEVIQKYTPSQVRDCPYRYDFSEDVTYINVVSDDTITEPVKDRLFWKIMMKKYPKRSPDKLMKDLLKKIERINYQIYKKHTQKEELDKIRDFLTSLPNHPDIYKIEDAKQQYISKIMSSQRGGALLWLMEEGVRNVFPEWVSWLFSGILETIDVVLIVLSSIPGLNAVGGLGHLFNLTHLIYAMLRLDPVQVIGSLVMFIPVVGQATGSAIKISGKLAKWITQATEPVIHDYSFHSPYLVSLGRLYGDDVVDTMKFLHKYGDEAESFLRNVAINSLDGYDPDRMLVLYGPHSVEAMKFADKDREGLETVIKYYKMFGKRAIKAVQIGEETDKPAW